MTKIAPAAFMPAGLEDGQSLSQRQTDAGMRHWDHYAARLPQWRYRFRQYLIPIVRAETPYLALIQEKLRTPALDSYFALTANLGTHTFFMVMLPILFWCGYATFARAMVHLLAAGVILSGIVKDLLCLPRPLSPPLQRITMSGSAALEYGFPSTHSTNAISVVVYVLSILRQSTDIDATANAALQALCYCYGISIVFGRLYCGMHGFFDVAVGSLLGAIIAFAQIIYGDAFDTWIHSGTYLSPLIVTLILLVMVRKHPEPADDCPCFDDSVAFAGVLIGIEVASWHYASTKFAWPEPVRGTTPYSLAHIGLPRTVVRIFLGVLIVFAWRGTMKPMLFHILPPIFRIVERFSLDLPRKFFLKASEYTTVPRSGDDNVIPLVFEIPRMLINVRQRRGRAVSIGPQSAADAYETIAYRHEQRRRSLSVEPHPLIEGVQSESASMQTQQDDGYFSPRLPKTTTRKRGHKGSRIAPLTPGTSSLPTPMESGLPNLEIIPDLAQTLKHEDAMMTPLTLSDGEGIELFPCLENEDEDEERREIFKSLASVRVRYDVEVITKLIIYSGIGWLAVEGNPILFELAGLGMDVLNTGTMA